MKLSVCVVNYHNDKELIRFLDSLESFRPKSLNEVIVVNNGSSESNLKRLLQDEYGNWVEVIEMSKNLGFGKAQNKAVKKARGEYVLLANPDLELIDGSLQSLLDFADEKGDFGAIGPKLVHPDETVQESCRRFPKFLDLLGNRLPFLPGFKKRKSRYLMRDKNLDETTKVDWLVGAAMLMKRDRFLEMGGFDERFFLFFEDTDLCRRLGEAGADVWYYPGACFLHANERLSERGLWPFKKVFWIHLASACKYFRKWG